MDKYEFNLKIDQLKKLIGEEDYVTALKIVRSIDWNRVRNTNLLTSAATVYEKNDMLQEAKDMLILAFERAPVGKHLLFKLTELSCRTGDLDEAEDYYREFRAADSTDIGNYTLQYMILKARHAPYERQLMPLERYCEIDPDEKWLFELANVYEHANRTEDCIRVCDRLALLYGGSKYGLKALRLKSRYANLTDTQRNILYPRSVPMPAESAEQGYGYDGGESADYADYAANTAGDGYMAQGGAAPYAGCMSWQEETYGNGSNNNYGYAEDNSYGDKVQPLYADAAALPQDNYGYNAGAPQAGIYDDRSYSAPLRQAAAADYEEGADVAQAQADAELAARRSDALAAERYTGEDEDFDNYVRMRASDEGRPATASVEFIDGEPSIQEYPRRDENEGTQMAFDFGGSEPTVVDEPLSNGPSIGDATSQSQQYQSDMTATAQQGAIPQTMVQSSDAVAAAVGAAGNAAANTTATAVNVVAGTAYNMATAADTGMAATTATAGLGTNAAQAGATAVNAATAAAYNTLATAQGAQAQMAGGAVQQTAATGSAQTVGTVGTAQGVQGTGTQPAAYTESAQPQPTQYAAPSTQSAPATAPNAQPQVAQPTPAAAQSAQRPLVPYHQLKAATPVKSLHMIVEADTAADGLTIAIDELKNLHEEHNISHESVKTSADKLNKIGINEAIINRVSGRDFVIEHAGALTKENIDALYSFICSDKTGAIVVLIDTPDGLDRIEELKPELFDICDYISDVDDEAEDNTSRDAKVLNGVSLRQTGPAKEDDADESYDDGLEDEPYDEEDDEDISRETSARRRRQEAEPTEEDRRPTPIKRSNGKVSAERFNNIREVKPERADHQLEIEDFAQYCAQYAASIDCSITGTSMLALYERIELMEENDIPLTKTNAEQLIEEAADRAEKPPLGKRLTGMFKSKYDKNGLLILKEEDFIY